jgi:hypothetical protein
MAELRQQARQEGVTLPDTPGLAPTVSRWIGNHRQPNEFYRVLLSRAMGRPRAELFSDEPELILLASGPSSGIVSAVPDHFGLERSSVHGTSAKPLSTASKKSQPPTDGCTTPRPPST